MRRTRTRLDRAAIAFGLGLVLALPASTPWIGSAVAADAERANVLERRVKAAFLYKFAGYVDWPPTAFRDAEEPLVIAVFGDQPLALELARLVQGRRSAGRPVQVRTFEDPADPGNAHIVFVGRAAAARTGEVVAGLGHRPILLVGETAGTSGQGTMIRFVLDEGRVRFEVDLDAVERSGLSLSSRLLTVARTVTSRRS